MEVMSTRTHGKVDYAIAFILLIAPRIFMWSSDAANAMNILGAVLLAWALLARYEYGLIKIVPVRAHLILDVVLAVAQLGAAYVLVHSTDSAQTVAALITLIFTGIITLINVTATWRQDPAEYGTSADERHHLSPPIFD